MRKVARKSLMTVAAAGSVLAAAGYAQAAGAHGGSADSPGVASGNTIQVPVDVPINVCGNTVDVVGLLNNSVGNKCGNGSGGSHAGGSHHHKGSHGDKTRGTGSSHAGGAKQDRAKQDRAKQGGAKQDGTKQGGSTRGGGNGAGNSGGAKHGGKHGGGAHGTGAVADGIAVGSPGVLGGNAIQVPIEAPVNLCGNVVGVIALGNEALGNACENDGKPGRGHGHGHGNGHGHDHTKPPKDTEPGASKPAPRTPHSSGGSHTNRNTAQLVDPGSRLVETDQLAETGSGPLDVLVPVSAGMLVAGAVLYRRARVQQH